MTMPDMAGSAALSISIKFPHATDRAAEATSVVRLPSCGSPPSVAATEHLQALHQP